MYCSILSFVFASEACKASLFCAVHQPLSEVGSMPAVRSFGAEAGFVHCVPTHASLMLYEII